MEPEPLTPAECDLQDFRFLPIDILRLFNSRFHAIANDAEWRAGVTLWLKSFHQVPAASLPNDDVELCRLAEFGRDHKAWFRVKEKALHGWVMCSDGRLYHPVVAEKANEAWQRKQQQRERSRKGNAKRWRKESPSDPQRTTQGPQQGSPRDPKGQGQGQGQGETSEAKASSEISVAIATAPVAPKDARDAMWWEGVPILQTLTGLPEKACRSFLGKLAKEAEDDCSRVLRALREAVKIRPIDAQPWLLQAVKRPSNPFLALIAEEGIGEIH